MTSYRAAAVAPGSFVHGITVPGHLVDPVVMVTTASVGPKLEVAARLGKMEAIGHDLVATVADDLCAMGARPAAISCFVSHDLGDQVEVMINSVVNACMIADCAFLGVQTEPGPTAERPHVMIGTAVGFAPSDLLRIRSEMRVGDAVIGILSDGLRTSGFDVISSRLLDETSGPSEAVELFTSPSTIYTPAAMAVLELAVARGLINVARLGLVTSLAAALPVGVSAVLHRDAWQVPQVFQTLQSRLGFSEESMFERFNMGLGFIVVAPVEYAEPILAVIAEYSRSARIVGEIVPGNGSIRI